MLRDRFNRNEVGGRNVWGLGTTTTEEVRERGVVRFSVVVEGREKEEEDEEELGVAAFTNTSGIWKVVFCFFASGGCGDLSSGARLLDMICLSTRGLLVEDYQSVCSGTNYFKKY